jgi:hypothetical protein
MKPGDDRDRSARDLDPDLVGRAVGQHSGVVDHATTGSREEQLGSP